MKSSVSSTISMYRWGRPKEQARMIGPKACGARRFGRAHHNRRVRMIDLNKIDFSSFNQIEHFPLDK
jgi:hypothetical protein